MIFTTSRKGVLFFRHFYAALVLGLIVTLGSLAVPTGTRSYPRQQICDTSTADCQVQPDPIRVKRYGLPWPMREVQQDPPAGYPPLSRTIYGMLYLDLLCWIVLWMIILNKYGDNYAYLRD